MKLFFAILVSMLFFIACGDDTDKTPVDNNTTPDNTVTDDTVTDNAVPDDTATDNAQPTDDDVSTAVCGNSMTETGEACDGDVKDCTQIDANYTGGLAECKADCSGYDLTACTTGTYDDEPLTDDTPTDETELPDEAPFPTVCKYTGKYSGGEECIDYIGPWTEEEKNTDCTAVSTSGAPAALSAGPCPTEGAAGYCTVDEGNGKSTNTYMYKASAQNKMACETFAQGTWTQF
ncbi:MAG TPA: hypothetical protein PLV42_03835 [bacterium]|nr:hypothetical protein [bacterium]